MRGFQRNYLTVDPRTLALFRVGLGLLLLTDLSKRWPLISVFYTRDGLIPNHRVLWQPHRLYTISFLNALSFEAEVRIAFLLIACCYVCLLVGYRTRLCQVLSWICFTSLTVRVDLLSNGADFALAALALWTLPLPLSRRFSVDAWLGHNAAPDTRPVESLAVFAVTLQLAVIYFFNAVQKNGITWREGSAVYYMLHQERLVTTLGLWLRETAPFALLRVPSYAALVMEGALPLLILSPWGRPWTRRVAIATIWLLHLGIALLANVGLFTPVMLTFSLLLVSPADWELLQRWAAGSTRSAAALPAHPSTPLTAASASWLSNLWVGVLMLIATSQVLTENRAVPRVLRLPQPAWMEVAVQYLRLNQGWSMFGANAPRETVSIVVDAQTLSGRHVDPYNERASRVADPSLRSVPPRLAQDVLFCDYSAHIADVESLYEPLRDWIMSYHERTGRPEDRIVHFQAYEISQPTAAPPGRDHGRPAATATARLFLRE